MQSQGLVKQPEVTFVDAVPHSFSFTGCKVDVKLQAKNPNSFNINLEKMDVLLYINEQKTASTAFNNISLKAQHGPIFARGELSSSRLSRKIRMRWEPLAT